VAKQVYMKVGTGSWRELIVARRSRKSSASFEALEAPATVSFVNWPATKSIEPVT
jgi:hypothetical protein